MIIITSTQHPLVKQLVKIRVQKSYRQKQCQVFVCGKKMVQEVGKKTSSDLLVVKEGMEILNISYKQLVRVSDHVMKKITGLETPENIAAVFPLPKESDLSHCKKLLILDQINEPGNLGTMIRTALTFGWDGVLFLGNCCDPFNEKALRASKGAIFRIPFKSLPLENIQEFFENRKWNVIAADIEGTAPENIRYKEPFALIIGSESHGLSPQNLTIISEKVSLPMPGEMESLNAAVAAGILIYLFAKNSLNI